MELNLCRTKYISNETNKDNYINDKKLQNIEKDITGDNFNSSDLDNGKKQVYKDDNFAVTLSATKYKYIDNDTNITIIDLGPCENLLKEFYKLKEDDLIYMKQIEVNQEGMKIPKIEYEVYAKLNGKN